MKARPTQSRKGVKGGLRPFSSVPCGVWGNAPTVSRATSISNALNKGAGSEASLPVTLRVRRRAPKLLFPQVSVKNQKKPADVSFASGLKCGFRNLFWQSKPFFSSWRFSGLAAVCRQFLLILQKGMVNWNARNLLNFVEGKRQLRHRPETHIVPEGIILAHASPTAPQTLPGQQTGSARSAWRCAGNRRA